MKLPINGKWTTDQSSDRGLAIYATKNIHFDSEGYATLANRTIDVFDESDQSSFRVPIAIFQSPAAVKEVGTGGSPYTININSLPYSISTNGLSNQPTGSSNSSQAYFNNKWTVSSNNSFRNYDGSAWTDPTPTLSSGVRHPLCTHRGNNSLLVGNGAQVKQYNTSYSETTNLTLPAGIEVVGIAYNRNFAAIITWDANGHEAGFYIWDGATAAANYYYPLGSNRAWFVAAYKDTFICINGIGQILRWDTSGLTMIGALPAYFTTAVMSDVDDRIDVAHDTAIYVDGERILFNVMTVVASKNSEPDNYIPTMPSGIWCWDPAIGLYHRHAPSGAKLQSQTIVAGDIDTSTDTITGTAIPATGTPFVYTSIDGSSIGGLNQDQIYYVIQLSSTTFKPAATRADAAVGTAVNMTGSPSAFSYGFAFFLESDYGQLADNGYAGILTGTGPQEDNSSSSFFTVFQKYLFGFLDVPHNSPTDGTDCLEIVMDRSENRGYLVFQWFFTPNVRETFEKLYVKARNMLGENAKIIVKYRLGEAVGFPIIARDNFPVDLTATWTVLSATSSTFTTSADLSAVKTAFDADNTLGAYELEVIAGAGSGYLAHITAISFNAGVYTVVVDEPIRNVAVNDTFYFMIDNWLKMQTKNGETAITSASDPDYSEFPIAGKSKKIQLKLELRGFRVQLEELEIVNTGYKPAA